MIRANRKRILPKTLAGATWMLQLQSMSTFVYAVRVANPRGNSSPIEVKCLVDTGAMFTCLPAPDLETLGLTPQWRVPIKLADGRQDEWSATEILMTINGRTLHDLSVRTCGRPTITWRCLPRAVRTVRRPAYPHARSGSSPYGLTSRRLRGGRGRVAVTSCGSRSSRRGGSIDSAGLRGGVQRMNP